MKKNAFFPKRPFKFSDILRSLGYTGHSVTGQPKGCHYMDVSKNSGTPKWMVYNGNILIKMDDLGGKPTISVNIHML